MAEAAADAFLRTSHAKDRICDWSDREKREQETLRLAEAHINGAIPTIHFPLCYFPLVLPSSWERPFAERLCASEPTAKRHGGAPHPPRRIAFLSSVFRSHSSGLSLIPLVKALGSSFEVYGYSTTAGTTFEQLQYDHRSDFTALKTISGTASCAAAHMISSDKIDLLIETERHVDNTTVTICSKRPAPLQLTAWGYGGTTGTPYFDGIIADTTMIREGEEQRFTERVLSLPFYHPPHDHAHQSRLRPARPAELPSDRFIYGNFNAHYKLTPVLFTAWLSILREVPDAVLYLAAGTTESQHNLRAFAALHNIEPSRVIFATPVSPSEHLARVGYIDLALDSPHLGGGATLSDALSCGVPGITIDGEVMASRSGASVLGAYGATNCIHRSLESYVDHAIRLSTRTELEALRASLRLSSSFSDFVERTVRMVSTIASAVES